MSDVDRPAAWRAYFEGTAMLQAELERQLRDATGLGFAEFNLLLALSEAPNGTLRMGDLARAIVFSPGRLTYQIRAMERRGWVRREPCEDDSRGTNAVLTDEGRRAFRRARPVHARHVEALFLSRVSDEDAAVLARLFGPVRQELHDRR